MRVENGRIIIHVEDSIRHDVLSNVQGVQHCHDCWIADLKFVDDVILGENLVTVQPVLDRALYETMAAGLEIKTGKPKFFTKSHD